VAAWNLRTYTTDDGGKPVDDWLSELASTEPKGAAKVVSTIDLLEEHGIDLGMPFARPLEDGLWELRAQHSGVIWRVIYFHWKARTFGLVHAFTKKTKTTPRADIDLAKTRRDTWLRRARDRQRGAA
jgi:phage-related protein